MALSALRPATIEMLKTWRYDRMIEKHEDRRPGRAILKCQEPAEIVADGRRVLTPTWWDEQGEIIVLC